MPFPMNPLRHVQLKPPGMLVHMALELQLSTAVPHSLISVAGHGNYVYTD